MRINYSWEIAPKILLFNKQKWTPYAQQLSPVECLKTQNEKTSFFYLVQFQHLIDTPIRIY